MRKKIYLLANSQGTSLGVKRVQIYPFLLQRMLPEYEFHFLIVTGWSVQEIHQNLENVFLVQPDLVIFQIGIIECARRILSDKAKTLFYALPLGRSITKVIHDHRGFAIRLRNRLNLNYRKVGPRAFELALQAICAELNEKGIRYVFLETPFFSDLYESKFFPLINEDIRIYNNVMKPYYSTPILTESDDSIWQTGTVHFNEKGHRIVAEQIKRLILKWQFESEDGSLSMSKERSV